MKALFTHDLAAKPVSSVPVTVLRAAASQRKAESGNFEIPAHGINK